MEYRRRMDFIIIGNSAFRFCRRQWALIHIEQQWEENVRTFEGRVMHEKCAQCGLSRKKKRGYHGAGDEGFLQRWESAENVMLWSFSRHWRGHHMLDKKGTYIAVPVEYKRGKTKAAQCMKMQLIAQAMCLEEMLMTRIPKGYLYYGETRRRTEVLFTERIETECTVLF